MSRNVYCLCTSKFWLVLPTLIRTGQAVSEYVALFRSLGMRHTSAKLEDLYDNTFVNDLEKGGFLKELWGSELAAPAR